MWCSTRFNSWTLIISDLCKRPKSSIKHTRPNNFRRLINCEVNCELKNISQWFRANKLSLNIVIKYILFHKYSTKEKIPLKLPTLKLGNKVIEKTPSVKFLGVMLDESVSWKYHMKTVKNKLSKNIGLLCRAKQFHSNKEKKIESQILFQTIVKSKLLENTPLKKYIYIYS